MDTPYTAQVNALLLWSLGDIVVKIDRFSRAVADWETTSRCRWTDVVSGTDESDEYYHQIQDTVADEVYALEQMTDMAFALMTVAIASHVELNLMRIWNSTQKKQLKKTETWDESKKRFAKINLMLEAVAGYETCDATRIVANKYKHDEGRPSQDELPVLAKCLGISLDHERVVYSQLPISKMAEDASIFLKLVL